MWPGGRGAGALVALSVGALACLASPPFCHGNWALVFLVFPDCPACQQVLPWVEQAASAFWEVNFLVVLPWEFSPSPLKKALLTFTSRWTRPADWQGRSPLQGLPPQCS